MLSWTGKSMRMKFLCRFLKINGEDATTAELLSYNAQFSNKFYYEAYAEDTASEKIKKYKNIVELYEVKEFEATCK